MYAFAKPTFTVRRVKNALEKQFGRKLTSTPWREEIDGSVTVTDRIDVQVGLDYVIVSLWNEGQTRVKSWPPRAGWRQALADLGEAMREAAEGTSCHDDLARTGGEQP
jgi:hypothetical protein